MNDPALVRRLQAFGKLSRDPNDFVERQWTDGESFGQGRTLDEFEHERRDACALLQAVDCPDVRMIQRGERTSLLLEAGESVGILREEVGQYLDRDRTLELRVVRAIDLAHAARAEPGLDPKRTQLAARRQTFYGAEGCEYGRLAKRSGVVVCLEQRLDGSPQCGILTAGRVEIRVPRWPIKGGCGGEYAADVRPLPGSMSGPCVNASYLARDQ